MKVMKLNEVKDFPAYVEHFNKFYLLNNKVNEETTIPCASSDGVSLRVFANRKYNIHTQEEYSEVIKGRLASLEKVTVTESKADNTVTTGAVVAAKDEAKAALTAQLQAANKKG